METREYKRLLEARHQIRDWKRWGPYVSDRQWGTVREDYSTHGNAWASVSHENARSVAYRWGEDGIGGISDDQQHICFAFSFWNHQDNILKERLFGLTGPEGNHGEDVKEMYYYLDSTPTHSYMKMLYKYPQQPFPYSQLLEETRKRNREESEYELMDTGIFDEDEYFDIFIEYAKVTEQDILIKLTVHNRSDKPAKLDALPTIWFRNTWAWGYDDYKPHVASKSPGVVDISHRALSEKLALYCEGENELIFCENETNPNRYGDGKRPRSKKGVYKDGFHEYVIDGKKSAINKALKGTKAAAHYKLDIPAGGETTIRLRLGPAGRVEPFAGFDYYMNRRIDQGDEFYEHIQTELQDDDIKMIQRQAYAGMLWSKQFYYYNVIQWLAGDPNGPELPRSRRTGRNGDWRHLNNADIISMPDKWEYPWYAAWDLAFHCVPLAAVDMDFAKHQLLLLTQENYMHPNGQLPAYEWNFSDVNPPVHGWATWRIFQMEKKQTGKGDLVFLEKIFHKLNLNFTWWVNRKDHQGNNIFQGGFLGLDNIGVFDRSAALPTGGYLEQADGTSWVAMYASNLMRMALELARHNPVYQDMAKKYFEHFLYIAGSMANLADEGINLWDEEDGFYYDVLNLPNDKKIRLKVRSMVGLSPLYAVELLDHDLLESVPEFTEHMEWFLKQRADLASLVSRWKVPGKKDMHLMSLLRGFRMTCLLKRMLDETEFLSPYGIRALSKHHEEHPYVFRFNDAEFKVGYLPAESDSSFFGGNSNWRGPVWFPVNYLLIESLYKFYSYYGDDFKVEYPTGSGTELTIREIADELSVRLTRLFVKDENGNRPVFGENEKLQNDPHFKDYILFYEYFHGDNGRGVGASHQTGWTGLVATLFNNHGAEPVEGDEQKEIWPD
ncbi:MAG: glucosidase [Bacteroidia bacterium]